MSGSELSEWVSRAFSILGATRELVNSLLPLGVRVALVGVCDWPVTTAFPWRDLSVPQVPAVNSSVWTFSVCLFVFAF